MKDKQPRDTRSPEPVIVASFTSRAVAKGRVGGVATIARIAGEACRASRNEVWLVLDAHERLSPEVRDDVNRACGNDMRLRWLRSEELGGRLAAGGSAHFILLGDKQLVTAEALSAFIDSGRAHLRCPEAIVASRLDSCGNPIRPDESLMLSGTSDIISLADERRARRRLVRRTGKKTDGIVSRWINRPVSQAITSLLCEHRGVSPTHLTFVTALVAAAMFLALMSGGAAGLITGGILFQLASLLDGVDGELARLTYRSSARGAALDTGVDMATNLFFFVGLTIGLGRTEGSDYLLLGGIGLAAMLAGIIGLGLLARRSADPTSFDLLKHFYGDRYRTGAGGAVSQLLRKLFSRDLFAFAFALMLLVGLGPAILWMFSIGAILWLLLILAAVPSLLPAQARVGGSPS